MSLINALKKFKKNKSILFTTPGHSQGVGISAELINLIGKKAFKYDLSEMEGLDNLQNPSGAILESQKRASEIYKSKSSYYLVNGSSSGIYALMLATAGPGDKILIARNAHKSVVNALALSGARPVWINTEWLYDWNIPGQLDPNQLEISLNNHPDIKSVWITSPTYEGIVSNIAVISDICKKREIPLIVDEAHGALWNFHEKLPTPAIQLGADASVQSLHKTASSLTQGAILHLSKSSKINPRRLQQCLNLVNTTSPSYLILASIEATISYLNSKNGEKRLNNLINDVEKFYKKLPADFSYLKATGEYVTDKTKLLLRLNNVSGYDLADFLQSNHNIEVEMDNSISVLALTGIGTTGKKLSTLGKALKCSSSLLPKTCEAFNVNSLIEPEVVYTPQETLHKKSKTIFFKNSIGLVSKETLVLYPPGIPVITAGELIKEDHMVFLKKFNNIDVIDE